MDSLFDMPRICPTCQGSNRVWNNKMAVMVPCTNREFHLPDPERQAAKLRSDAPATSAAAAKAVLPRTGTARWQVLMKVANSPNGATDEEIITGLGMPANTARPRRNELMNDGWIRDSGLRRQTAAGLESIVWVLTEQGATQLFTL